MIRFMSSNLFSQFSAVAIAIQFCSVVISFCARGTSRRRTLYLWTPKWALVCWYLNLCTIGSKAVILKKRKKTIPSPIYQATSVNYGSFISNTESDLLAIIFPPLEIFCEDDFSERMDDLDDLVGSHFSSFEVGIIQCKTNWNDSAQIPILWDLVYSSDSFCNRDITVGNSAFTIRDLNNFFYSFVTVPTSKGPFNPTSTNVLRVAGISGGNYWGSSTKSGVASSIKEIFGKNFRRAFSSPQREILGEKIQRIEQEYTYFSLF